MKDEKREHVVNFIQSMAAIEEQIEPYKQSKIALRRDYQENKWLTSDEIWQAIKAFRFVQKGNDVDIANFNEMHEAINEIFGGNDED